MGCDVACENLTETALLLGISKPAASRRYRKALDRLREILYRVPDFAELLDAM